jgi:5-methylcytosine-specific restriction endonuclease McrA
MSQRQVRSEVLHALLANRQRESHEQRIQSQRPLVIVLRTIALQVQRTPTTVDLAPHGVYHVTLKKLFGSVANAMIAAGLQPNVTGRPPYPLPEGFRDEFTPTADESELDRRARQIRRNGAVTMPQGNSSPAKTTGVTAAFIRDPAVVAWVRDQAAGHCESCGELGYETDDGSLHLEVHHVLALADGGPDTVDNAVAVCETCHGKLHRWSKRELMRADLFVQAPRLVNWAASKNATSVLPAV